MAGRFWLGAGAMTGGSSLKTSLPWGGTRLYGDFSRVSGGSLDAGASAPVADWMSLWTGVSLHGNTWRYHEKAGSGGEFGEYQWTESFKAREVRLGATLWPAAWFGRAFRPGEDNPDGASPWPAFWGRYYQIHGQDRYTLDKASLGYAGAVAPHDGDSTDQGFEVGVAMPLYRSLTLSGSYTRETWYLFDAKDWANSESAPLETVGAGAVYRLMRDARGRVPAEWFPRRGWPGTPWISGSWYRAYDIRYGRRGWSGYGLELGYVVHASTAVMLDWFVDTQAPAESIYGGFTVDGDQRSSSTVWAAVEFSLSGILASSAGARAREAADSESPAPAGPGEPPEVQEPELPPLDGNEAPAEEPPPPAPAPDPGEHPGASPNFSGDHGGSSSHR